jgi:hypothetical protein
VADPAGLFNQRRIAGTPGGRNPLNQGSTTEEDTDADTVFRLARH